MLARATHKLLLLLVFAPLSLGAAEPQAPDRTGSWERIRLGGWSYDRFEGGLEQGLRYSLEDAGQILWVFGEGGAAGIVGTGEELVALASDPIATLQGLGTAISRPVESARAIGQALWEWGEDYQRAFSEDPRKAVRMTGDVSARVGLALVAGKGIGVGLRALRGTSLAGRFATRLAPITRRFDPLVARWRHLRIARKRAWNAFRGRFSRSKGFNNPRGVWIQGINPRNGFLNCQKCVVAVDTTFARGSTQAAAASALRGTPQGAMKAAGKGFKRVVSPLERHYRTMYRFRSMAEIRQELLAGGPGSRGIVYARYLKPQPGRTAHVVNVRNVDGRVLFFDGQMGGPANLKGFNPKFGLLRTDGGAPVVKKVAQGIARKIP